MAERARRIGAAWPRLAAAALLLAICSAAYGATLAPGITWANGGADSAELAAAALVGGVPHPSGYPAYMLLARLALLPPLGDPARALALLSAAAAALAALVVGDTVRRLAAADEPWASLAGLLAGLSLALAPLLWSQAVIGEVYAPSALGAALLLRAALLAARDGPGRPGVERLTALLAGASLGLHLTNLPFALAWLAAAGRASRPIAPARLAGLASWLAAGLLVYLYLPLRAAAAPPISWGGADTWAGFWWLVSGRLYAGMAFGLPLERLPARLAEWSGLLGLPLGWPGLLLGAYGLLAGCRPAPGLRPITAGLAAASATFALGYASLDAQAYLIPALLCGAVWVGLGAARALEAAARRSPALAAAAGLALAGALLWPAPLTAGVVDASGDRRAIAYAERALAVAPPGALVLADDDRGVFPLWYYHHGLGRRPDLRVVAAPLLRFAWYRERLSDTYPDLALPAGPPPAGWEAALEAHPGPHCRASADQAALTCAGAGPLSPAIYGPPRTVPSGSR